jgi:hypothetical protein
MSLTQLRNIYNWVKYGIGFVRPYQFQIHSQARKRLRWATIFMTKRQLGYFLMAIGGAGIIGLLAIDLIGAGQFNGIGPTQRLGLWAAGAVLLLGLTLLPLGDKPA